MSELPKLYHYLVCTSIDEKGVYPHQMAVIDKNDDTGVFALALSKPHEVFHNVLNVLLKEKPKELMFGMDRYAKSGQGTTLGDLIGGAYWNGDSWRTFIIEYQHEPRIVNPLDWNNQFWNKVLKRELTDFFDVVFAQKV